MRSSFAAVQLPCPHLILFTRSGTRKGYKLRRMTEAVGFWIDGHVKLVKTAPGAQILVGQMIRLGVSTFDDWADAAADVFAEEVYRPMLVQDGASIDEGGFPYQPGDDVMGRRMTNDDARETYDDQQHLRYGLYEEEWRG
jgi:hypothetical protein